jgi:hypothetical protein
MALIVQGGGGFTNYNGADLTELMFRPMYEEASPEVQGFTLLTEGVTNKLRSLYIGTQRRITRAYQDGFQGGLTAKKYQNEMTLVELKAELEYSLQTYKDLILDVANRTARTRGQGNDITASDIEAAEMFVFSRGLAQDYTINAWLADTSKTAAAAFTDYSGATVAQGAADTRYNMMDGLLKKILADSSANPDSEEIKVTGTDIPDNLVTDSAYDTLDTVINQASPELRDMIDRGVARFIVTQDLLDNLDATHRALGTELAHNMIINGNPQFRNVHRGVPIIRAPFSAALKADFETAVPKHWAILCDPANFQVALNAWDGNAQMWYNPDLNVNRARVQYKQAQIYGVPEAISFAKG